MQPSAPGCAPLYYIFYHLHDLARRIFEFRLPEALYNVIVVEAEIMNELPDPWPIFTIRKSHSSHQEGRLKNHHLSAGERNAGRKSAFVKFQTG